MLSDEATSEEIEQEILRERSSVLTMTPDELEAMWLGMDREHAENELQRRIALTPLEESAVSDGPLLFDAA